jgi:opacity protein-like surface antigen
VDVSPTKEGWSASAEYTHIFEQELEEKSDTKGPAVEESQAILAKIGYGLNPTYSLYAKLGMADLEASLTGIGLVDADRATYHLNYDMGFAWGIGGKANYDLEAVRVVVDLQYFRFESGFDTVDINGTKPTTISSASDVTVDDFGLSAILAKEWSLGDGVLMPYLGVRGSMVKVDFGTLNHTGVTVGGTSFLGFGNMDLDSNKNIGVIAGTRYDINDRISLGVEGRFIDETAVSGSLSYKF